MSRALKTIFIEMNKGEQKTMKQSNRNGFGKLLAVLLVLAMLLSSTAQTVAAMQSTETQKDDHRSVTNENTADEPGKDDILPIIDQIAKELKIEFGTPSATGETTAYYDQKMTVKLTSTEKGFSPERLTVSVTKDGETTKPELTWQWKADPETAVGMFPLTQEGEYTVSVRYTEANGNEINYTSQLFVIHMTRPVVTVSYDDGISVADGRRYYTTAKEVHLTVTVKEHYFDENDVRWMITEKDATKEGSYSIGKWTHEGDTHTVKVTFFGEANYTFRMYYADMARNTAIYPDKGESEFAGVYPQDSFTIDRTAPDAQSLKVEYFVDNDSWNSTFVPSGQKVTVKLTAEDAVSGIAAFRYSFKKAKDASPVNSEILNVTIDESQITYSEDGKTATAIFEIPGELLSRNSQLNGSLSFYAIDRARNKSREYTDGKQIIVDSIAPTAQVSFSEPTNIVGNVPYYDGDITVTLTIQEANFYAEDVKIRIFRDGGDATAMTASWEKTDTDTYVGTFTLKEDGEYYISIGYTDRSLNKMTTYTSEKLVIDTAIEPATYTINGEEKSNIGGAYGGDATIEFRFADPNHDSQTVKLTRTVLGKIEEVSPSLIQIERNSTGGVGSITIPRGVENDGIYVLTVTTTDKAKHTAQSELKFIINRYGSVYEYGETVTELIKDGGQYIHAVEKDLIIIEYNADELVEGSLKILITRDGENVEADFTTEVSRTESDGDGWYCYVHTIKASNFVKDGVYKISLISAYKTDDSSQSESSSTPGNSRDEMGNTILDSISFTVDATAPEIRNIVNLDRQIADKSKIQDGKLSVKYTIVDVGGLQHIDIYVNGEIVRSLSARDFGDDIFNFSGSFEIEEQEGTAAQKIRIVATDRAGNVTDTDSESFRAAHSKDNEQSTFVFFGEVTVSRNFFVRWYANKPFFYGAIAGVIVLIAAACAIATVNAKKKKNNG